MNVGPDALAALGSLPHLQDMLLHVDPADYTWDALQHGRPASFFPALTKLTLHDIAFEWCAAFLNTVTSDVLQKLHIRTRDPHCNAPDGLLFEALCAAIGSLPSGATLHDVDIRSPRLADVNRPAYPPRHIAPLTGLKGALRRLYVRGPCQIEVDDATLEAMAHAWPDIREITLPWLTHPEHLDDVTYDEEQSEPWDPEETYLPKATLAGLAALVRGCPHLTDLVHTFNMRFVPELEERRRRSRVRAPRPEALALERLSVEGSVFDDPIGVSAFFALMCPRLRKVGGDDWYDVGWYYASFLRIQEKKWAVDRGRGLTLQGAALV